MIVIIERSRAESKSIHYLVFQQQRSRQLPEETRLSRIKDPRTWLCEHRDGLKSWPGPAADMSGLIATEERDTDRWEMPVATAFCRTISTLSADKSLIWFTQARCLQSNLWVSWYLPWLKIVVSGVRCRQMTSTNSEFSFWCFSSFENMHLKQPHLVQRCFVLQDRVSKIAKEYYSDNLQNRQLVRPTHWGLLWLRSEHEGPPLLSPTVLELSHSANVRWIVIGREAYTNF